MKKILFIFLPLLALAGAAAWWFFFRSDAAEAAAASEAIPAAAAPVFLDLEPMTVTVLRPNGAGRMVSVDLALELTPSADATMARKETPRIIDAVLTELHGLLARRLMESGKYDVALMKKRLTDAVGRVIGAESVHAVLIEGIELHRPRSPGR